LAIKRFMGRVESAVSIQILTALITFLSLQIYRRIHGLQAPSLWTVLLCQPRATLMRRAPDKATPPQHHADEKLPWTVVGGHRDDTDR
jgi:hypothetical protein